MELKNDKGISLLITNDYWEDVNPNAWKLPNYWPPSAIDYGGLGMSIFGHNQAQYVANKIYGRERLCS